MWSSVYLLETLFSQNSEKRMLKQWDADSKEELSLANKELTAVSKLIFSEIQNYSFTFKDFESFSSNTVQCNV